MADSMNKETSGCVPALVAVLLFGAVLLLYICFYKVPANAIGVRTNTSGGVEMQDYPPGFVLCVPFLHSVRLWDPTWTNVFQRMEVRGSDQYKTSVDISVIFRIHPGKCHEVSKNFQDYSRIETLVQISLSQFANEILTEMKTEDFYNPNVRKEKTDAVREKMDEQLEKQGLEVKSVMLRNIVYDSNFEDQLLKKQIAGQTLSLEKAKVVQAEGETTTELIEKEAENKVIAINESLEQEVKNLKAINDQTVNKLQQDAQLAAAEVLAKAASNNRINKSKAELARAEATAAGMAALSRVYAKPGANFYFAQKSIQGLHLGNIELNSNTFNPLDTEKLMKALGVEIKGYGGSLPGK